MEYERFTSSFHFRCPVCGESDIIEVDVPEFSFSVERMSDLHSEGDVEFICPSCETEFDGAVICTNHGCTITVVHEPPFTIHGDTPMFGGDPFGAYEPPSNPYALFDETAKRCIALANVDIGAKNDPQFVKRTAFVTLITALEAYLADTLISRVRTERSSLLRLVGGETEWGRERVRISEIAAEPEFTSSFVMAKLRATNFHDLNRAADLYHSALGANLRSDLTLWKRLLSYVTARHDCVHRNGFDHDGNRREDFDLTFLRVARDDCQALVEIVEQAVNPVPF